MGQDRTAVAGRIFGGRYAAEELIGAGGMSEVFRATDVLLERPVALKVLNEKLAADETFVERFKREARIAARLAHPNVVALFDYGSECDDYYLVMELVDGASLADHLATGPLDPRTAARITGDVARALTRAHDAGLVHRDVTPGNILITPRGDAKVADFGIARALEEASEHTTGRLGSVLGTAAYLSPEQAQGQALDPRSDVYSLGVVLYEMLTGSVPFEGGTPLAVAGRHVNETPRPPSSRRSGLAPEIEAIALRALEKDPGRRYASAAEMGADLRAFIAGVGVRTTLDLGDAVADRGTAAAEPPAPEVWPPSAPRARRGPALSLVILVAALSALGGWLVAGGSFARDRLPDLAGRTVGDARDRLSEMELRARIETRYSDEHPEGIIIEHSPGAGASMRPEETVTLIVSSGRMRDAVEGMTGTIPAPAPEDTEDRGLGERLWGEMESIVEDLERLFRFP